MNTDSYTCCSFDTNTRLVEQRRINLLKMVAEPTRLKLLCILSKSKHCVSELEGHLILSQSLISHHLKDLLQHDLVQRAKLGQRAYYSLSPKGQKLTKTILNL